MKIGELYLGIGLTGSEKTVGQLMNVQKGFANVISNSFALKAGLIGAFYALEQLTSASRQNATNLENTGAFLGESTQQLQKYQYAAKLVGISNQTMAGTFKSLQAAATKTLLGEGAPKGLARVSLITGGLEANDLFKFQQNPELLLKKLQEYAAKEKNVALRNEVLKSFGIGDEVIAGFARNAFTPEKIKNAPTYIDKELTNLDMANRQWIRLTDTIERGVGRLSASHTGSQLISDVQKILPSMFKLADSILKVTDRVVEFADKFKLFKGLSTILGDVTKTLDVVNELADKAEGKKDKNGVIERIESGKEDIPFISKILRGIREPANNILPDRGKSTNIHDFVKSIENKYPVGAESTTPSVSNVKNSSSTQHNNNVTQNINFNGDILDPRKVEDSAKSSYKDVWLQTAHGQSA